MLEIALEAFRRGLVEPRPLVAASGTTAESAGADTAAD
jgi:hypothetical protein